MKPPDFTYLAPRTLDEAIVRLTELGEEGKVLAGGQSLVPLMNLRLVAPSGLVDVNRISELAGVRETNGHVTVGAMTRHHDVATSPVLERRLPMLARAASMIGYPGIRYRGTIGGSLAHADPVAEMPCVALTLDAELLAMGPGGERTIPARDFFTGYFSTCLEPTEILTAVRFDTPRKPETWSFMEFARKRGDFPVAAVAATAQIDGDTVERLRVAVSGASDRPVRAHQLETSITGRSISDVRDAIGDSMVRSTISAEASSEGWHEERSEVAGVLAERAIAQIIAPQSAPR